MSENVVPGGTSSVITTLPTGTTPLFETVIVYVATSPAFTVAGPVLVIERSPAVCTYVVALDELFGSSDRSSVSDETVAVLVMAALLSSGFTKTVTVKLAVEPAGSDAMAQSTAPPLPTAGVE